MVILRYKWLAYTKLLGFLKDPLDCPHVLISAEFPELLGGKKFDLLRKQEGRRPSSGGTKARYPHGIRRQSRGKHPTRYLPGVLNANRGAGARELLSGETPNQQADLVRSHRLSNDGKITDAFFSFFLLLKGHLVFI